MGDMDFRIVKLGLKDLFDGLAVLFVATTCAVRMDEMNIVVG